jgi:hypothetical protein
MAKDKAFVLRITNPATFPKLQKEAEKKPGKWSVNTLINSILEEHQKKIKNKS